jgi:hypothetical protein
MKTQEQILARMGEIRLEDTFGFRIEVLLNALSFENAKPFLKPEAVKEGWDEGAALTEARLRANAEGYLTFAWGKAEGHRGISASRSTDKMGEYIWLVGTDEDFKKYDETEYAYYGCPKLKAAAEFFGTPLPTDDSLVKMMSGEPCRDDCTGCRD